MLQPNSIGALFYVPTDYNCIENKELNLDAIANEISDVLKGENIDVLDDLFLFGGSSGGARPKILVGYNPKTDQILSDIFDLPMDFENWIIKFSSSYDLPDIALIEFTYNQMAVAAGLEVAPFKIFETKRGNRFFGTKRFDRVGNSKLHLHSAAGLMHDNFRLSTMDYGNLMDCAFRLEKNYNAYFKTFRMAVFNVLAHNRDDHSKNFSFLMDAKGLWKLAPAYDLTFSQSSYGHHSTSVNGESKNPTVKHLLDLANHFGLNDAKYIIEEVSDAINNFENLASNNGITKSSKQLISGLIGKKDKFMS
jgi:serine/threonine-protein kinase HipA